MDSQEYNIFISFIKTPVTILMEEQIGEIREVVISAGAFETGDLKRAIILKPMDVSTTPSAMVIFMVP